jgi:hypothetical protein
MLASLRGWLGRGGVQASAGGGRAVRLSAQLGGSAPALLRPREPTDGRLLPALVSPDLAAAAGPGGAIRLDVNGQPVSARVAAVARRFPTVPAGERFAVLDGRLLATALDADAPGTGQASIVWVGARDAAARSRLERALARPPFTALARTSREAVERRLAGDPLARGILTTLAVLAPVALALAALGVLLSVLAALRDERAELFDLEAQGAPPAALRLELRLRAALVLVLGCAGGVALGAVLSRFVVALVLVSAGGQAPDPPLLPATGWLEVLLGLAGLALAALALAWLATALAFRRELPRPPTGVAP